MNNNQRWFIPNSVRSATAALLLAAASGCGGSTDGERNDDPGSPPVVVSAVPQTPETNSLGETLCGMTSLGVDEDGRTYVDRELYNFDRINEELARHPELAKATGFSEVTDCQSARAYGEKYVAFDQAHPNFRGGPSKEESFDDFLSEPGAVGEPNPEGPEVQKVFGGALGNRPAIVGIRVPFSVTDQQKEQYKLEGYEGLLRCSAVRIAATVFLTAAHCMPNPTSEEYQSFQLYMKRKKSTGAEGFVGAGKAITAYGKSYPGYTGLPNPNFDFALFWVIKDYHSLLAADFEASATTLLAARSPAVNDGQLVYGWGLQSSTEDPNAVRLRTPSPEPTLRGIDVVGPHSWAIHDTGPAFRLCKGDSGGSALRDGMLDGITATMLPATGVCSQTGGDMYWSRVDTKMPFIREQMGTLQSTFKCVFHSGNPSDPNDWEHAISYVNCNEK